MLSSWTLPSACPQCRAQVLKFYESGYRRLLPAATSAASATACSSNSSSSSRSFATSRPAFSRLSPRQSSARTFSSTKRALHDVESASTPPKSEDIEAVVRQARQTFGQTLPGGFFSDDEYKIYERLYGAPVRETRPEDVGIHLIPTAADEAYANKHTLLRETEVGELEEVEYNAEPAVAPDVQPEVDGDGAISDLAPLREGQLHYLSITANNEREYNALIKLQRDYDAASVLPLEEHEEIEEPEEEDEEDPDIEEDEGEPDATFHTPADEPFGPRLHEYTVAGHFKTSPSTLFLPRDNFTDPIAALLNRTDTTHIRQAAEKVFGGAGLPYSPATPESRKNLPMKPLQLEAGFHRMSEIDADTFIATVLPGIYATAMSSLVEVRKRLGPSWIKGLLAQSTGPRVLDVGGGGAGLAAWQEVLQAEWDMLRERGEVGADLPELPPGRKTVVVGADNLRHRISMFLQNTTFLPRLPDYVHSGEATKPLLDGTPTPFPRKTYDLIIASHALLPLDKPHKRRELIDNLWTMLNPQGGVLIVLEKGHPRGFEAVADVRERMLAEFIIPPGPQSAPTEASPTPKEPGMIIAPCTNHTKCPMYHTPGLSSGRKDFCHFSQRFIRPAFLQRVLGSTHRNHEDIKFSFLAVRRGEHPVPLVTSSNLAEGTQPFIQGSAATDAAFAGYEDRVRGAAPHPLSLPRNILPPLKRRGHVTLDLCTPAGAIERWTVPKSFSKQAYHDARKARWGDLWALGAKTRVRREIRLGKREGLEGEQGKKGGEKFGKRKKLRVVELSVEPGKGVVGAREKGRVDDGGRRAKGGRNRRVEDLMEELGMHEDEEGEDGEIEEMLRGVDGEVDELVRREMAKRDGKTV